MERVYAKLLLCNLLLFRDICSGMVQLSVKLHGIATRGMGIGLGLLTYFGTGTVIEILLTCRSVGWC